mmetsp:Transcript_13090/g.17034  ORF Transcript_13090/g.17034 Transcript_13090/m.17034 type:complete len:129 (+) Transcript_13090:2741-3127(+)
MVIFFFFAFLFIIDFMVKTFGGGAGPEYSFGVADSDLLGHFRQPLALFPRRRFLTLRLNDILFRSCNDTVYLASTNYVLFTSYEGYFVAQKTVFFWMRNGKRASSKRLNIFLLWLQARQFPSFPGSEM